MPQTRKTFFVTEFEVYKAIVVFLNGSGAAAEKIVPQIFKDLDGKSNGNAGLNFLKSHTKLLIPISEGTVPKQLRPFFLERYLSPS